jgi:UDP-GlcNAc:undecaprenyl-phosphate GlcNAc-1-phosphate transferase
LLDMGITHRRAVLMLYGVNMVLVVAALGVALGRNWQAGLAIAGAALVLGGLIRFVGGFEYLHLRKRQRSRIRSRHAELLRRILPRELDRFRTCRTEHEVLHAFRELCAHAELLSVELVRREQDEATVYLNAHLASREDEQDGHLADGTSPATPRRGRAVESVSARFPIAERASHDVRVRWVSEFGDVSPQAEVMLQVLVDVAGQALLAARSPFALPAADDVHDRSADPAGTSDAPPSDVPTSAPGGLDAPPATAVVTRAPAVLGGANR